MQFRRCKYIIISAVPCQFIRSVWKRLKPSFRADVPVVSGVTAEFASGNIVCAVAKAGAVDVKLYDKVGREVATLLSGNKEPGYYPLSLEGLNLSSDVYFVVLEGPDGSKKAKVTLIK